MRETSWGVLRDLLVTRYDELKNRLTRRLGSSDLAGETLQETWLHLAQAGEAGHLRNPEAYLYRVAVNVAGGQDRAERRRLAYSEVELLLQSEEDELDPERIAASRAEHAALLDVLDELPSRRRDIFLLARVERLPRRRIAELVGVSVRTVDVELSRALTYCLDRLKNAE